jgi:uncharacterized protein with HEPN domain
MRNLRLYIDDICNAIKKIKEYTKNINQQHFHNNTMVSDAVVRNLEVIGEAMKNIPSETKNKYAKVEWKKIAGLRDMLIHGYFTVDHNILWDIIKNKVPELKKTIQEIAQEP